jgi:nitroreductase
LEKELSAGAVCQNLLIAADAMGFAANWITDWYGYDKRATALLGLRAGERVAGFIHLGTAPEPPLERVRPDVRAITSAWRQP